MGRLKNIQKGDAALNHDYTHCLDWTEDCPKGCLRAELTADLQKPDVASKLVGIPLSWSHYKGTAECMIGVEKPKDDLISRQAAIDAICEHGTNAERDRHYVTTLAVAKQRAVDILEALPSAQKPGKWLNDKGLYKCSACNELWLHWWASVVPPQRMYNEMRYCPNCGAKMKGENDGPT